MARKRQQKDAQKQAIQAKRLTDFAKFQEAAGCPKNTACRSDRRDTSFRPMQHAAFLKTLNDVLQTSKTKRCESLATQAKRGYSSRKAAAS